MTIGDKIRKIRAAKEYSQEFMASQLNIKQPSYARIETGCTKLSTERLEEIARLLEVKPEDILHFDDKFIFHNYFHAHSPDHHYATDSLSPDARTIELLVHEVRDLRAERDRLLTIIETMSK